MPTTTSYYGFPVPVDNDPADAPHDFLALAQKIEDTLKNGFTIPGGDIVVPGGNLIVGDKAVATARYVTCSGLRNGKATWFALGIPDENYPFGLDFYTNNVFRGNFVVTVDSSTNQPYLAMYSAASTVSRPIPFAMWASSTTITLSNAVSGTSAAITFPAGRFTQDPIVSLTVAGSSLFVPYIASWGDAALGKDMAIGVRHVDNLATSQGVTVHILAVQMLPTSSLG